MSNTPKQVVLRLPAELVKRVDYRAVDWDVFRSEAIRRLLEIALATKP